MLKNSIFFILILLSGIVWSQEEKVFNYSDTLFEERAVRYLNIDFDFNRGKAIKDSLGLIELQLLSDFIQTHPKFSFDIEHHTDDRGSEKFNLKLSQRRAENLVAELIVNYKVDSAQVRPVGYGEAKPIIPWEYFYQINWQNKDECLLEGAYFINRRTQLRITKIER